MGQISIEFIGSFQHRVRKTFSAMGRGHAAAVADAIQFLSGEALPDAIKQDHQLASEGAKPEKGFGGRGE